MLDTGLRIDETLGIERAKLSLDTMLLVVMGKGAKERQVPFSLEMRKMLYRWQKADKTGSHLFFPSRSGERLLYRNVFRDVQILCQRAGISVHAHPHLFRHQLDATYIRQGGDIYRLSRLLGHTAITTTQLYLRSMGSKIYALDRSG
jgi:site-specific recombinase XerC